MEQEDGIIIYKKVYNFCNNNDYTSLENFLEIQKPDALYLRKNTKVDDILRQFGSQNLQILKILLNYPKIDVNNSLGFYKYFEMDVLASFCYKSKPECLDFLLNDKRLVYSYRSFYLDMALRGLNYYAIQRIILLDNIEDEPNQIERLIRIIKNKEYTEKEQCYKKMENDQNYQKISDLILKFYENPDKTRYIIGLEISNKTVSPSCLFALILAYVDDYVTYDKQNPDIKNNDLIRFLEMTNKFPLEIQMLLCNRAFGSNKLIIPIKRTDTALKQLFHLFES